MRRRSGWVCMALCAALLAAAGCDDGTSHEQAHDHAHGHGHGLRVVATYSILGDLVAQVAGGHAQVAVLVGPGGDAHTYEPTPRDSVALHDAAIVFENGLAFETWLDKLYTASGSKATRVVVSAGITPRHLEGDDAHGEDHGHGHAHGEADPHLWHDPRHVKAMLQEIAQAMINADPDHAVLFASNRDAALARLDELDAWIREQVSQVSPDRRVLATTHDTFGYFADRYGFKVVSIMGSISTDVADPSAGQVASVIQAIRETGVSAVFAENIGNAKLTEQVASQAGVKVVGTLYTDALGEPGSAGESYEAMMRHNVSQMVEALR